MRKLSIIEKLKNLGYELSDISLGDFDYIGEFTAKRHRNPNDPLYHSVGAFYRPNYERGILIYHLIKKYNVKSVLEIGFGRGYSTFCAAKAFYDLGVNGTITTVDPQLEQKNLEQLASVIPNEWFNFIKFMKGTSQQVIPTLSDETFDLVYIDGDHSFEGTMLDYELTREKFNSLLLFDDYHLPTKNDPGIQCQKVIDGISPEEIQCSEPELIISDRRIFVDDRRLPDDQVDYGQVLFTKKSLSFEEW